MKKITLLLSLLMLCLSGAIFAQTLPSKTEISLNNERCSTMEALEYRMANDPEYAAFRNAALAIPSVNSQAARIPCDGSNTIRVPVAFHFDEGFGCGDVDCVIPEVIDALDALNVGFADNTGTPQQALCPQAYLDENGNDAASTGTCIEFYMPVPPAATGLDACDLPITLNQFNGGLNGGGSGAGAAWAGIMNIFITNNQCLGVADGIPGAGNGDGVTVCQQTFGGVGGASPACNLDTDNTFGLGGTLIHEVGHYLGLYHTFQGGCGTQEPNPPGPFDVLDTPAHSTPSSGTPTGCVNSSCGGVRPPANFMDYTDDAGYSMFTEDQAQVMNYWANQLFGSSNLPDADPSGSITTACGGTCVVICPTSVQTAYSGTEDLCASLGTYDLPTDFSSVVLDETISATFTWSTGGYMSAGGTAVAGATFTLPVPTTCAPIVETLYLNTGCTDNSIQEIDAGTIVLTIYPDPTQFAPADLVTFADGACGGPTFTVTSGCEPYVAVTQNGGPAFPVTTGAGPVDYDVTLNYPVECCCPVTAGSETQANTNSVAIPDNGGAGNPGCSTVTINSGDPITSVALDVDITHTWIGDLEITLTSPAGTTVTLAGTSGCSGNDLTVTFDDAATNTAADFAGTCNNAPAVSGAYQPVDALAAFAGETAGGVWTLCVSDNAGQDVGTIDNFGLTVNTEVPCTDPVDCAFMGTANYDCSVACANVDLSITFDGNPEQTSWEIINVADGSQVGAGGAYTGEAPNSTIALDPVSCLMDGCYELTFYDAADDGMCPRRTSTVLTGINIATLGLGGVFNGLPRVGMMCGDYTLTDAAGTTIAVGGGRFGTSETTEFCISGGVFQPFIYQPDNVYARQNTFNTNTTDMWITPTLASDAITVYSTLDETVDAQISVVDINGKVMQQYSQERNTTRDLRLDVSDLPSGIYFVQMMANDVILVEKFVKQ